MHNHPIKHAGDIGATLLWAVSIGSQWAQLLTPIATLTLTMMGIVWWCIRFCEWLADRKGALHD
jgi:hypothetical protein